jgi:hypothetical protein
MQGSDLLTIIVSILVPMLAGFGWVIAKVYSVAERLSHLEGYLEGRAIRKNPKNGTEDE